MKSYDVVVAGLGAMGSAAVFHLARHGFRVLGLDQFEPPHNLGSSHGETRVIREAYFENPVYVPLVQRAYELWGELEALAGNQLYLPTGGIMIGPTESTVATGALRSAKEHSLKHEVLTAVEIHRRFPGLNPEADMIGVLEPRAGILFPESCVRAHLDQARRNGAEIRFNTRVLKVSGRQSGATLETSAGTIHCGKVIITAGPWLTELFPGLPMKLQVERQVLHWFEPVISAPYRAGSFPIHLWEYEPGKMFYGFPNLGTGVKLAFHHQGKVACPDSVDRNVSSAEIESIRKIASRFLPGAAGKHLRAPVCLYTNTTDEHFVIDRLPGEPNIIIGSPCSGHGFKFASAIGEALANLATEQHGTIDLSLFRFGNRC